MKEHLNKYLDSTYTAAKIACETLANNGFITESDKIAKNHFYKAWGAVESAICFMNANNDDDGAKEITQLWNKWKNKFLALAGGYIV